ncbi:hypothetical protein [Sporichthya polymorpha]|uniref:hypothetical protein n=1 Tax=Sporichthya polymorpha TaxID=35751 RepID=UPI00037F137C|nr:hypothetical protein [Sporichthya polymorpha]
MATTEVTPARTSAAWIGAGAIGALLVLGGILPGYAAVLHSGGRSPDHTLLGSGAWPYFLALALALAGLTAAAAVHGRGPAWATPALLTATGVPAFALVTELADPPEAYRPYSAAADFDDIRDIDVGPGGWITFATLLCLAVAAAVWRPGSGRSLAAGSSAESC